MLRVANVTEKNVIPIQTAPIPVPAGPISITVLKDIFSRDYACIEIAGRYIQNLTGADIYYSFGAVPADAANYNGLLQDKQQLDCSNHGAAVSIYSATGGGTIAITILQRVDLVQQQTMVPSIQLQ